MSTESKKTEEKPKEEQKKKEDPLSRLFFIKNQRNSCLFLEKFKVTNKYDPYLLKNSLDECIKEVIFKNDVEIEIFKRSSKKNTNSRKITTTRMLKSYSGS